MLLTKIESRYWTGLLLLVQFLMFGFNILIHSRIYEDIFNDFLEAAFLLNLCILTAGTYHVKEIGGNQAALTHTSVGVAFILFVCIILYHIYLRLCTSTYALGKNNTPSKPNSKQHYVFNNLKVVLRGHSKENSDREEVENDTQSAQSYTTTSVDLREPLLEESI